MIHTIDFCVLSFLLVLLLSRGGFSFIYITECVAVLSSAVKKQLHEPYMTGWEKEWHEKIHKFWNLLATFVCDGSSALIYTEFKIFISTFVFVLLTEFSFMYAYIEIVNTSAAETFRSLIHSFRSGFHICTHACLCKCVLCEYSQQQN